VSEIAREYKDRNFRHVRPRHLSYHQTEGNTWHMRYTRARNTQQSSHHSQIPTSCSNRKKGEDTTHHQMQNKLLLRTFSFVFFSSSFLPHNSSHWRFLRCPSSIDDVLHFWAHHRVGVVSLLHMRAFLDTFLWRHQILLIQSQKTNSSHQL
jgi:hypothetical protein